VILMHKVKGKFLPVTEIENENPEEIEIYEFTGQNFKLVVQ